MYTPSEGSGASVTNSAIYWMISQNDLRGNHEMRYQKQLSHLQILTQEAGVSVSVHIHGISADLRNIYVIIDTKTEGSGLPQDIPG